MCPDGEEGDWSIWRGGEQGTEGTKRGGARRSGDGRSEGEVQAGGEGEEIIGGNRATERRMRPWRVRFE